MGHLLVIGSHFILPNSIDSVTGDFLDGLLVYAIIIQLCGVGLAKGMVCVESLQTCAAAHAGDHASKGVFPQRDFENHLASVGFGSSLR